MAVYVVDAHPVIELVRRGYSGGGDRELFAPALLRSQVPALLQPRSLRGATAWRIATEQGWPETYDADYIAPARLHGDALVAGSDTLRAKAEALVRTATVDDMLDWS